MVRFKLKEIINQPFASFEANIINMVICDLQKKKIESNDVVQFFFISKFCKQYADFTQNRRKVLFVWNTSIMSDWKKIKTKKLEFIGSGRYKNKGKK